MTFIVSHVSAKTGLLAASDVLISRPEVAGSSPIKLPTRDKPIRHVSAGYELAGTCQKMVIFKRTMILLAGSLIMARAIIEQIRRESNDGEDHVDPQKIVANMGFSEKELSEVSIIYHHLIDDDHISLAPLNCERDDVTDNGRLISAGSGVWNFFDNLQHDKDLTDDPRTSLFASIFAKICTHPLLELAHNNNFDFLYGGWIEICHREKRTFRKKPYAVKFWYRGEDYLASGAAAYFGFYIGAELIILKLQPREANGEVTFEQSITHIEDFIRRGPLVDRPPFPLRPDFIVHVVIDQIKDVAFLHIDQEPEKEAMIIELSDCGIRYAVTNSLRQHLFDLNDTDLTLSTAYIPLDRASENQ